MNNEGVVCIRGAMLHGGLALGYNRSTPHMDCWRLWRYARGSAMQNAGRDNNN